MNYDSGKNSSPYRCKKIQNLRAMDIGNIIGVEEGNTISPVKQRQWKYELYYLRVDG